MKSFLTFFIICLSPIVSSSQSAQREIFEQELGKSKAAAYSLLEESLELFLEKKYPAEQTQPARIRKFLQDILDEKDWGSFDETNCLKVLSTMENSGLRKDILIYKKEKAKYPKDYKFEQFLPKNQDSIKNKSIANSEHFEELIEIEGQISHEQKMQNVKKRKALDAYLKKRPEWNRHGLFLYALAKSMQTNAEFMPYIEIKMNEMDIISLMLAENYLMNLSDEELSIWYTKLPMVIDIYYWSIFHKYSIK